MHHYPVLLVVLVLALGLAAPAAATPSDGGDAGYSFNESPGCGNGVAGPRTPLFSTSGLQSSGEILYGPWADFFGRSKAQIESSLVSWVVPGGSGATMKVHQRALPAFQRVAANLADQAGRGLNYPVTSHFGWAFRSIGGRIRASQHLFGNAVDINGPQNPLRRDNVLVTDMPLWFVKAWTDAGFCWGGSWVNFKDTMHFSWMGPNATAGYPSRPTPYPPLTAAAGFTTSVLAAATPYSGPGTYILSDRSGDGSEDLYFVSPHNGLLRVEAAGSRFGFGIVGFRRDTSITAAPGDLLLGDLDRDSRADLWILDRAAPALTVYSDRSDFTDPAGTFALPFSVGTTTEMSLGHYDADYAIDLFVITRGVTTVIDVYSGASGYTTKLAGGTVSIGDTSDVARSSFVVGDHDVDGIDDVYAIARDTGSVSVLNGGSGFIVSAVLNAGLPVPAGSTVAMGDYDGDGRDDLYVISDRAVRVYLGGVRAVTDDLKAWFLPPDPWPWDAGPECIGGDPCDQLGLVDGSGEWSLLDNVASDAEDVEFFYGDPADIPFSGDWDCDGTATPGLYRQRDGYVYLRNSNDQGPGPIRFFFGNPDDIPLAGDFDGDGCDTVSVYRPSEGRFYVINSLGQGDAALLADVNYAFGNPGDKPFAGDFDGNGIDDIGLHRETTGLVYMRLSHTQGVADITFTYGNPGDRIVAGDWDGNGIDTVAVYRPSDGNWYIKLANGNGVADHALHFSDSDTVRPVAGHFGTHS